MMWLTALTSLFILSVSVLAMGFSAKPSLTGMLTPEWTRSVQLYQQPHALWLDQDQQVGANLGKLNHVLAVAKNRHQIPELVMYAVPIRDLGQSSEGGFSDFAGYMEENRGVAKAIKLFVKQTHLHPRLYLEPDALGHALQYRHDTQESAESLRIYQERVRNFGELVTLYHEAGAHIYLDAGHSGWFGYSPEDIQKMATALNDANIAEADGVVSNISNRQSLLVTTAVLVKNTTVPHLPNEQAYLNALLPLLNNNKHLAVTIDTSRNGKPPQYFKPRVYTLHANGTLWDNGLPGKERYVGTWEPDTIGTTKLFPLFGPPKLLSRLVKKEKYQYDPKANTLTAPPWLDPIGDVVTGPAPQNQPAWFRLNNAPVSLRYIKPPDECDGSLNCPPGLSKHDITAQTLLAQP